MALRVWLPLNGNLENKGLEGVSSITGSPTYGVGKLGQAITAGGTITFNLSNTNLIEEMCLNKEYSIMAGCYNTNTSAGSRGVFGIGSGAGKMRGFYESNSHSQVHGAFSGSGINITDNIDHMNGWHHMCFTVNGTTVTMYIDGIKQGTGTDSSTLPENSVVTIYANNYSLNDFRLYDECLSLKQIKEISKGLVAHYKLSAPNINNNLAVDNPLINSGATSISYDRYTHTYTIVSPVGDSTGGYGLNIGSTNKCLVPGDTAYRFSFEVGVPTEHEIRVDYNNYANTGSSGNGNDNDLASARYQDYVRTVPGQTWTKLIFGSKNAHTGNTDHVDIYEVSKIGLRTINDTEPITWYLRNFKFELGDVVTDFVTHDYNSLGFIGEDCSGNGYNGTINGTLTLSDDTARYLGSTKFDTNTSYIKLPALNTTGFANSFTISCGSKITDMNAKMRGGFSDGNRLNIYPTGSVICCNTGNGANNPYQNNGTSIGYSQWNGGWHQFVMVADGTTNKLYVDGVYQGTAKTYVGLTGTQIYISGWDAGTNYTGTDGLMNDFRIYATALSADDIKELYQTSAMIDNGNNIYAYEFIEE